jgi:hypothetical protein
MCIIIASLIEQWPCQIDNLLILYLILIWLAENEEPLVPKTTIEHEQTRVRRKVVI